MKLFILICTKCDAEVAFRHPAVVAMQQLETLVISCPRCKINISADLQRPIKVHTKEVGETAEVVDLIEYRRNRDGN